MGYQSAGSGKGISTQTVARCKSPANGYAAVTRAVNVALLRNLAALDLMRRSSSADVASRVERVCSSGNRQPAMLASQGESIWVGIS